MLQSLRPSGQEPHAFHFAPMLDSCGTDIEPRRVDAAMAEHIGQLDDILLDLIKHTRKQMPQIMGKHLCGVHACASAELLHLPPYCRPVERLPVPGAKQAAAVDFLLRRKA